MTLTQRVEVIADCMNNSFMLRISYKKIDGGRIVVRIVEPYEMKEENGKMFLYAYDKRGIKETIKSFLLNNILSTYKQRIKFKPRNF